MSLPGSACIEQWGSAAIPRLLRVAPIALALLPPAELTAQIHPDSGRIVGRLLDGVTLTPVVAAEVTLTSSLIDIPVQRVTDEDGRFLLRSVRPGWCRLEIEHLGYGIQWTMVDVPRGRTIDVEVHVAPEPVPLEPLHVEVYPRSRPLEQEGFYTRKELGSGHVFTRAELDDWRGSLTSSLVERAPGLASYPGDCASLRMRSPGPYGLTMCVPTVCVNGWPDPVIVGQLNTYHASELEGVEVYRAWWEVPGKYRVRLYPSRLECGVILLSVRGEG